MKNRSEYDKRQLSLMYENLISFEKNQIELDSLVGTLEFLLNAMESVEDNWEELFSKELITLESMNAIRILKDNKEKAPEISEDRVNDLIRCAANKLKNYIYTELQLQCRTSVEQISL